MVCWLIRVKSPCFLMNPLPEAPSYGGIQDTMQCGPAMTSVTCAPETWSRSGAVRNRANWMGMFFTMKNCVFTMKNGGLAMENCVFTMKNGVLAKNFRFDQQKIGIDRIDR